MQGYSDEELIEVYRNTKGSRRQKAFDYLYMKYSDPVRQYFFFALYRDHEKAKDFTHDLFLKILESPDKFDTSRQFKPWLYRIASNMCKNEYRRICNRKELTLSEHHENHSIADSNIEEELEKEELNKLIQQALMNLDPIKREIFLMRFQEERSIREISQIMGCSEGTIKSRLYYSIQKISKQLKSISIYVNEV